MEKQKGFIQIPLLVAIIAGVLVLGGIGYLGVKQYKKIEIENQSLTKEITETKNENNEAKVTKATSTETELEALRKEVNELKQQTKNNQIAPKLQTTPTVLQEISSADIQPYLDTIGVLTCWDSELNKQYGTGVLLMPGELMTNWHVVEGMETCLFVNDKFINPKYQISGSTYRPGAYILDLSNVRRPDISLDFVIATFARNENARQIAYKNGAPLDEYLEVNKLNYKVGSMRKCSQKAQIGTHVAILGYPASSIAIEEWAPPESVTTGIISGYASAYQSNNYLVSARVDHGNSGGLALGKESGQVCLLGIPTWVVTGQVESAGVVQNIHYLLK